jgi:beta-aspartyl-peptidase (threonine type)
MSRLHILLVLVLMGLAVWMAVRLRQHTETSDEQVREAVLKVLDDQVAAWNRGDLEAFMKGYWRSDDVTFFSGGDVRHGWQELLDRYRKRYQAEGKEMGTLRFEDRQIDATGPKSAAVRGRWELTYKDGKKDGGLYTLLFRKEPQGWCIVHDHTSARPPEQVPLPAPGGSR